MRDRRWWFALALLPLLALVGAVLSVTRDDASVPAPGPTIPQAGLDAGTAVVVSSAGEVRYPDLGSLVAASDAVVIARVSATERGRLLADEPSGTGGIVTRLVRLEVEEVLAGVDPGAEITLEEPGWLIDGAPVAVDGVAGSAPGDLGVWFVVRGDDETFPYWAVVNAQGRYLVDPVDETRLVDVPVADPVVDDLETEDPVILRHRIEAAAPLTPAEPSR
jgi:hypothetical protein